MTAVLPERETLIEPGSAQWRRRMSGSKVAAALGLSPFQSPRGLWHEMRGDIEPDEPVQILADGHHLESAIAAMWLDRNPGARLLRGEHTYTLGDWAVGSPDGEAELANKDRPLTEWKTDRDMLAKYGDPGTDAVPVNYLVQCLWNLHLRGRGGYALLGVLGGLNLDITTYRIDYDPQVADVIFAQARRFWESLHLGTPLAELKPPALSEDVCELPMLRKLHPDIDPDVEVEVDQQLAFDHLEALAALKAAEKRADHTKARVLDVMGRARLATWNTRTVARRQPNSHGGVSLYAPRKTPIIPNPNKKENTTP